MLFLTNLSLVLTGFSSWLLVGDSESTSVKVNTSIGNIKDNITINQGVYYIFKSEYLFEYFYKTDIDTGENNYYCTNSKIGFKVKICPAELINAINSLSKKPSELYIDTQIQYKTVEEFDMFSNKATNTNTVTPNKMSFSLADKLEYTFFSDAVESNYMFADNENVGTIYARTLLFKEGENTLLEFTKNFSSKSESEYTYFDVYFPFQIKNSFSFDIYKNITFDFAVSLEVKRT